MNLKNFINVAVIGVGAFGRNHARVYQQLAQQGEAVRLVGVVDADLARADVVAREFGCRGFGSIEQLTTTHSEVQAASVAVPTFQHFKIARALMKSGVDVLIEKPLTATLDEADELIRLAQRLGRIAQVGHLERFNPAIRATLSLITHPIFFEVHRLSLFTPRSLDIDVVLDLMIHDLDVVLTFVNSPIKANFTASRVSTERVRKLRFFQPKQYISIDYTRQDVLVFSVDDHESAGDPSINPQIKVAKPTVVREEPLHAELKSFLESVRARSKPLVTLEDGRRALAAALDIATAINDHRKKINLELLSS